MARSGDSLRERYHQALRFKDLDVEEPIDLALHRPVAAWLTAVLVGWAPWVTPNHVTLASLLVGWVASLAMYQAFFDDSLTRPVALLIAAVLLFVSVILDCADGQLARLRGGGSPAGRALDGTVDALVLIPNYVILGLGLVSLFGDLWTLPTLFAGLTGWVQMIVYDRLKGLYLVHTSPEPQRIEGNESLEEVQAHLAEARRRRAPIDTLVLWLYVELLRLQRRFVPASEQRVLEPLPPREREEFRRAHRRTMRLASMLGLGTHMVVFYSATALATIWPEALIAKQAIFGVSLNALMLLVLWMARGWGR